MATTKEIKKLVKENLHPDVIGSTKDGCVIFRWGFFYRHGNDSSQFAAKVINLLNSHNITNCKVVDDGEVWKSFRGGASTSNQSHWYVKIKVNE